MLTEAVYRIRLQESKSIQQVQDEIGRFLGRKNGRTIEYWRQGHIPTNRGDVEKLTETLIRRGGFDDGWSAAFLETADLTLTQKLRNRWFVQSSTSDLSELPERVSHLPQKPFRRLIGRAAVRKRIMSALTDTDGRWVIGIDGMGGIGKTALALEIANECQEAGHFHQIIWLQTVSASESDDEEPVFDFPRIVDGVAEQLQLALSPALSPGQKQQRIRTTLRQNRYLIIIDNAENAAIAQEQLIAQLRPFLNPTKLLLTSRKRFVGEIFAVHVDGLTVADGLRFIEQDAFEKGIEHLSANQSDALANLVRQAGGSPLALKLLVSRLAYLPIHVVIERLLDVDPISELQAGSDSFYHNVFFEHWRSLETNSIRLLFALAHFAPMQGAAFPALQQISMLSAKEAFTVIDRLWRRSLIEIVRKDDRQALRYALHPLTRNFVLSLVSGGLLSSAETDTRQKLYSQTRTRFVSYWITYAITHAVDQKGFLLEEQHILKAVEMAPDHLYPRGVCAFVGYMVDIRARYESAYQLLQKAQQLAAVLDPKHQITLLLYLGRVTEKLGEIESAESHIQSALQLSATHDQRADLPDLHYELGSLLRFQGRYAEAIEQLEAGLQVKTLQPEREVGLLAKLSGVPPVTG